MDNIHAFLTITINFVIFGVESKIPPIDWIGIFHY